MSKYILFGSGGYGSESGAHDILETFENESEILPYLQKLPCLCWWHAYDVEGEKIIMGSDYKADGKRFNALGAENIYASVGERWVSLYEDETLLNATIMVLENYRIRKIQNRYMKTFRIRLESIVDILSRSELSHHVEKTYYPPSIHIHLPADCPENEIPRYFEKFSEPWMEVKFTISSRPS